MRACEVNPCGLLRGILAARGPRCRNAGAAGWRPQATRRHPSSPGNPRRDARGGPARHPRPMSSSLITWPFLVPVALLALVRPAYPAEPPDLGPSPTTVHASSRLAPSTPAAAWPLSPRPSVVAGFDPPAQTWSAGHRGVDLLGSPGQPVRAALAGTVTFAGQLAGRGVVVVDHGGRRTTYEPVRAGVRVGSEVATGQQIGTLQASPSHCAPRSCLHWGLVEGERRYQDPLSLVGAGPVRLLPLLTPVDGRGGTPSGAARW
ncbi:MAG: peptidase [Marmoricola sp.]|nr:peptidase [Marmoricola sp.]